MEEAKYVIHTVGPVWNDGKNREEELLANCYKNSLAIAVLHNIKTIAFPGISTGVYRFPKKLAAKVALSEVLLFLQEDSIIEEVIFVCFDDENYDIYKKLLECNN